MGDSCDGGEVFRGGVGVDEPDVLCEILPTLTSEMLCSSFAPSSMLSVVLFSCGDVLWDPNCVKISFQHIMPRSFLGYLQSSTCPQVPDTIGRRVVACQTEVDLVLTTNR